MVSDSTVGKQTYRNPAVPLLRGTSIFLPHNVGLQSKRARLSESGGPSRLSVGELSSGRARARRASDSAIPMRFGLGPA
jgi:hypothetical protein